GGGAFPRERTPVRSAQDRLRRSALGRGGGCAEKARAPGRSEPRGRRAGGVPGRFGRGTELRTLDRGDFVEEFGDLDCETGTVHVISRDDHVLIVQMLAIQPAEESPATLARAKTALFQQWLAEQ